MPSSITRRQVLRSAGGAAACVFIGPARCAPAKPPKIDVRETKIISRQPARYHGWPTLTRRSNGELLVVCSGGREAHVCPFGRVELIRSDDDGKTWSDARAIYDGPLDDRDAGILETAKGTLLVTTFTSLAYEPILATAEKIEPGKPGAWSPERLRRWQAARDRLTPTERKAKLGVWMFRSTDGGKTWSEPYDCLVSSPHGPIQLADGRLLYPGKDLWRPGTRVGVCQSADDGRTWQWLATLPTRPGDNASDYHELHAVEAGGRLVLHLRNHNKTDNQETLQSESTDGGKTWSAPHAIGVWGLPSHLLRLRDGRLMMTYGHRRPPYGNQARLSDDAGRTGEKRGQSPFAGTARRVLRTNGDCPLFSPWSEPMIISGDGTDGDLGYPSTVELPDGSLLTVWYERLKTSPYAVLRQARWTC